MRFWGESQQPPTILRCFGKANHLYPRHSAGDSSGRQFGWYLVGAGSRLMEFGPVDSLTMQGLNLGAEAQSVGRDSSGSRRNGVL